MTLIIKITITQVGQALLAFAALALLSGCPPRKTGSDAGTDDSGIAVTRKQVLIEGGACVVAAAHEFQSTAVALEQALTAPASPQALAEARTAFHAAMDAWQISEAMQVGPAANSSLLGGSDLRDQIYSWPLVSRCAIEEALVAKTYETNLGSLLIVAVKMLDRHPEYRPDLLLWLPNALFLGLGAWLFSRIDRQ